MTVRAAPIPPDDTFSSEVIAALAGEYRILGVLESGPGTAIYLAHRAKDSSDFPLALHVCRRDPADHDHARFLRALEVTGSLEHPNVLPVRPLREVGGFTFAEARLAGGGTLEAAMAQITPLPLDRVYVIVREIAAALDHAHAQGVVHGALHAGAIGFDAEDRVLVGGFMLGGGAASDDPALRPSAVGHPAYLSHEQRYDLPQLDGRADQYALAVLAWELITGQRRATYDADGVLELDPLDVSPTRPLRPDAETHANAAIRRALSKEPAIRFATCGEFAEAVSGQGAITPQGLPTFHPPIAQEERSMLWLAIPVLLAIALAVALFPERSRNTVIRQWQRLSGEVAKAGGVRIPEAPSIEASSEPSGGTSPGNTTYREPEQSPAGENRAGTKYAVPTTPSPNPAAGPDVDPSRRRDRTTVAPPPSTTPAPARGEASAGAQPAAAPRPASGDSASRGVAIVTLEGARAAVFVDGLPRGFTPAAISLSRGQHVIRLRGTSVTPDSVVVRIAGGDSTRAAFRAAP